MQQTETRIVTEPEPALNVADLLAQRASRTPDLVLFQIPDGDAWRPVTAAQFRLSRDIDSAALLPRTMRGGRIVSDIDMATWVFQYKKASSRL